MTLQSRALYNLLRMNWIEDPSVPVEPWQVEDLRSKDVKELFSRLKALHIDLNEKSFLNFAENCESPEEITECLWLGDEDAPEDFRGEDQAYLLLFELWRRLLPKRVTLSIFCDELDHLIALYDEEKLENEGALQNALSDLEDILDDQADLGNDPKAVFAWISPFCAHDTQEFIYDYILDQIEGSNELYASELLDAFYEYMPETLKFDLLRAHLFAAANPENADHIVERILEDLKEKPDLDLLFQMAEFLVHYGQASLFLETIKEIIPLLRTEKDFQDLLLLSADYYRCLDKEEEQKKMEDILSSRSVTDIERPLSSSDKGLMNFKEFFAAFREFAAE